VYGSETWAVRVEDMNSLERVERIIVMSMFGVSLREVKSSAELLGRLGIVSVADVVRRVGCVGMDMRRGKIWRHGCQNVGGYRLEVQVCRVGAGLRRHGTSV